MNFTQTILHYLFALCPRKCGRKAKIFFITLHSTVTIISIYNAIYIDHPVSMLRLFCLCRLDPVIFDQHRPGYCIFNTQQVLLVSYIHFYKHAFFLAVSYFITGIYHII